MIALGLDIGTTTIVLVALDLETGKLVSSASLPNLRVPDPASYAHLQDAEAIVASVKALLAKWGGGAACLGITGQMHSLLYLDSRGKPASRLHTWMDARAAVPVGGKLPLHQLEERSGRTLPPGYALATHYAHRMADTVPESAARITGICEFVAEALVGEPLKASDASFLASYGAWDAASGRFDDNFLQELLGPDPPAFLSLAAPLSVAGLMNGRVPVAFPVGDNQAGFHGTVADPANSCLVSLGTSGQLSLLTAHPRSVPGMELRPFLGRGFLQVGATLCAGKAFEMLRDFLCAAALFATGRPADPDAVYAAMTAAASLPSASLAVVPTFNGTRGDPGKRGALLNIGMDNLTPAALVSAMVEGIVEELRGFSDALGTDFERMTRIIATGGLARRVPAVAAALERAFGREVEIGAAGEGGAVGAALIGAEAAGLLDQADRARIRL
jgi:sedoheptulokinase